MMHRGFNLQEQMLRTYIDQIFQKYDADRSGALDCQQLTMFYKDLFLHLNIKIEITQTMVKEIIHVIDKNNDGVIQKQQLQEAFIILMNSKRPKRCYHVKITQPDYLQDSISNQSSNINMKFTYSQQKGNFTPTTSNLVRENLQFSGSFNPQNSLQPPEYNFKRTQSQIKILKQIKVQKKVKFHKIDFSYFQQFYQLNQIIIIKQQDAIKYIKIGNIPEELQFQINSVQVNCKKKVKIKKQSHSQTFLIQILYKNQLQIQYQSNSC